MKIRAKSVNTREKKRFFFSLLLAISHKLLLETINAVWFIGQENLISKLLYCYRTKKKFNLRQFSIVSDADLIETTGGTPFGSDE